MLSFKYLVISSSFRSHSSSFSWFDRYAKFYWIISFTISLFWTFIFGCSIIMSALEGLKACGTNFNDFCITYVSNNWENRFSSHLAFYCLPPHFIRYARGSKIKTDQFLLCSLLLNADQFAMYAVCYWRQHALLLVSQILFSLWCWGVRVQHVFHHNSLSSGS